MKDYLKLIRVKHWLKNLLIFIPIICAGLISKDNVISCIKAFFAFSFACSFVYIVNDEEYKESELKGIPLTPEILEKNGGWKKSKINDTVLLYYKDDVYLKYNTVTGFFFFSDFDYRSGEILLKYVHQFQHLLFGFGLNSDMEV